MVYSFSGLGHLGLQKGLGIESGLKKLALWFHSLNNFFIDRSLLITDENSENIFFPGRKFVKGNNLQPHRTCLQ
jgi:hypothetical protein